MSITCGPSLTPLWGSSTPALILAYQSLVSPGELESGSNPKSPCSATTPQRPCSASQHTRREHRGLVDIPSSLAVLSIQAERVDLSRVSRERFPSVPDAGNPVPDTRNQTLDEADYSAISPKATAQYSGRSASARTAEHLAACPNTMSAGAAQRVTGPEPCAC